jgi:hypothetical protein
MLRKLLRVALGTVAVFAVALAVQADEKKDAKDEPKPVTLKGEIQCTKCSLKETDACGTCIKVKEGDKDVVYYFIDKGKPEPYHATICTGPKKGSVTGVVSEKDKKKFITPAKDGVKYD